MNASNDWCSVTACTLPGSVHTQHRLYPDLSARLECTGERLRESVNLVVVSAARERTKLSAEVVEPWRASGQPDRASLNARGLVTHAHRLVSLGLDSDGMDVFALEILNQAHSRAFVLDQEGVSFASVAPLPMQRDHLAAEFWVFKSLSDQVQDVNRFASDL